MSGAHPWVSEHEGGAAPKDISTHERSASMAESLEEEYRAA